MYHNHSISLGTNGDGVDSENECREYYKYEFKIKKNNGKMYVQYYKLFKIPTEIEPRTLQNSQNILKIQFNLNICTIIHD